MHAGPSTIRAPRDTSPGARILVYCIDLLGSVRKSKGGLSKMRGSRLLLLAFLLPFVFGFLSPQSSCKDSQNKKQSSNSKPQSVNQVKEQTKTDNSTSIPEGVWGGVHIQMQATAQGADIEYDCAHGTISEPIKPNAEGRFRVNGTHSLDHPGPARQGVASEARPATYSGSVNGKTMTLTVTLNATSEVIGTFTLTQGNEGIIRKCG